jgi:hypothetical protein
MGSLEHAELYFVAGRPATLGEFEKGEHTWIVAAVHHANQ